MTQSKYVIFKYENIECAIIFDGLITHNDLGVRFSQAVSAGFFQISDENRVHVYGESLSRSLHSRPEDAKLVERALGINQEY